MCRAIHDRLLRVSAWIPSALLPVAVEAFLSEEMEMDMESETLTPIQRSAVPMTAPRHHLLDDADPPPGHVEHSTLTNPNPSSLKHRVLESTDAQAKPDSGPTQPPSETMWSGSDQDLMLH
ncbi:uncharacterized protein N7459_003136 [Penicillium hispanicum]|uniref:uncharacterized protein n=1 Tax=Penicillium hispanicum TaxID=1080232 RepID=UPI00254118DE|nr:uncharacterized protein N7459_003136 [Penicillium hispanicum]KAJ5587371.1 hypothetical protein N7459_003136 [Penicillium hispanicum]